MAFVQVKNYIIETKEMMMFKTPTIKRLDIMTIINYVWDCSFICAALNKKLIADKGWVSVNRNIIINVTSRASKKCKDR